MTDAASLLAYYERHQLDGAKAPPLEPASLDGLNFLRIRAISAHWRVPSRDQCVGPAADVAIGAHAYGGWFVFVVSGSGEQLDLQFATGDRTTASRLLKATYPGIELETGSATLGTELAPRFLHGGMVTGIPSRRGSRADEESIVNTARLTRVIRGMRGAVWGFVVRAWPVNADDLLVERSDLIQKLSALAPFTRQNVQRTIQETRSRTDHASQAVSEVLGGLMVNRDVEYVIAMLERGIERLDEALSVGAWQVAVHYGSADALSATQLGGLLRSVFSGADSLPDPIRILPTVAARSVSRISESDLHTQLSSVEVSLLMELPRDEAQGFRITDYATFDVDPPDRGRNPQLRIGEIMREGSRTTAPMSIPLDDLSKHGLVVGVTGSGKTTTVSTILHQAWENGVPFLVAEPAKTEYRSLLAEPAPGVAGLLPGLRVYTVGNDRVAPFRLNPFEFDTVDAGSPSLLLTHIDMLKAVFNAAFVLYAPMPYVLELALHEIYEDKGWNLATGQNVRLAREDWARRGELPMFPTLTELRHKVGVITRRMGYESRIEQDVSAGLQARIDSLRVGSKGLMLDVPRGVSMNELLATPAVLELESIGNDSEKAFVVGLVFARICEYRRLQAAAGHVGVGIQHVLVIEEAHRLLRNISTDVDTESANVRAQAVETLVNMLSEVRRYGQAVILAEQVPRKLAPDAIKNTNLKVMHRVVAADDRAILAGSANMSDEQSRRLSTLVQGEAIVFAEGADHPYLIATADILAGRRDKAPIDAQLAARAHTYVRLDRFLTVPDYIEYGIPAIHLGAPDPVLLQPVLAFGSSDAFNKSWARIVLRTIHARPQLADELTNLQRAFVNASPYLPAGKASAAIRVALTFGAAQAVQDRANERGWTYSAADGLRQSLSRGLTLALQDGQNGAATAALDSFARSYEAATRKDVGPFPGCANCPSPCFHRSEVSRLITPRVRTALAKALTDTSVKTPLVRYRSAANLAKEAALRWLRREQDGPQSIAYCAALCVAASSGFDEYQQTEFGDQLAPHVL